MEISHVPAERLEHYALAHLAGTECAELEAHLLSCSACLERLAGMDDYIAVMKTALSGISFETANTDSRYAPAVGAGDLEHATL